MLSDHSQSDKLMPIIAQDAEKASSLVGRVFGLVFKVTPSKHSCQQQVLREC